MTMVASRTIGTIDPATVDAVAVAAAVRGDADAAGSGPPDLLAEALLAEVLGAWSRDAVRRAGATGLAPAPRADLLARELVASHVLDGQAAAARCSRELLAPALAVCLALGDGTGAGPGSIDGAVAAVVAAAPFGHALAVEVVARCRPGDWDALAVGATVTAGLAGARLRGHSDDVALAVLGMAATQAAHLDAAMDTPMLLAGRSGRIAASAVVTVLAAEAGLQGPARPLGGERGLLAVLSRAGGPRAQDPGRSTQQHAGDGCILGPTCPWTDRSEGAAHA